MVSREPLSSDNERSAKKGGSIDRRQRILDAASRLFEAKGLKAASMRAIAAEAGLTTGAIYPHFSGKEDIYAELLSKSLRELKLSMLEALHLSATPTAALRNVVFAFFRYYELKPCEFELGLYLSTGLAHHSLGHERDIKLNTLLREALHVIDHALKQQLPRSSEAQVEAERNVIFSLLIGVLTLFHTGRTKSLGHEASSVVEAHLVRLGCLPST